MSAFVWLLINHGVYVLFALVFADQAGLPVPGALMLLAAGSLASFGRMNLALSIGIAWIACMAADFVWYEVGRRRRFILLKNPAAMPTGSEVRMQFIAAAVARRGLGALILAKFIPGPNLASTLAGISGLTRSRFLIFDSLASVLWAGGYIAAGYVFNRQLQHFIPPSPRLEVMLFAVMVCVFAAAALLRSIHRRWPQFVLWNRAKNMIRCMALFSSRARAAFDTNREESFNCVNDVKLQEDGRPMDGWPLVPDGNSMGMENKQ